MKIAYLAPYRDGTGYSKAAIGYMLALDSVGITVVPRSIKMTPSDCEIPNRIKELEENSLDNVDVLMQHNLPSEWVYKGDVQNIGLFAYETSNFKSSQWAEHIEMMDKTIVFCNSDKNAVQNSCSVDTRSIHVCPHALDIDKFGTGQSIDFELPKNTFKFYTVSDLGFRKNLPGLIVCYLSTFDIYDQVALVLKVNVPGESPGGTHKIVKEIIDNAKTTLGMHGSFDRYPPIVIIPGFCSDEQISSIHKSCECYVNVSRGESFCIPAFEAIGHGNQALVPEAGAFLDYFADEYMGDFIDTAESPVLSGGNQLPGLYTPKETWHTVLSLDLSEKMVAMYTNWKTGELDDNSGGSDIIKESFDYNTVGQKLLDIINAE